MRDQEIIGLWEAYQQVHTQPEEVEKLDEITRSMGRRAKAYREKQAQDAHMKSVEQHQHNMENNPEYRERHERLRQTHSRRDGGGEDQKESFDLFDYLLEYLVAEGYADTNKAALSIMANMSEEWKQDIVEAKYGTKKGRHKLAMKRVKGEEIGKSGPGTGFKAVEKAAKEGGAKDPAAVAAAAMYKTYGGK